MQFSDREKAFEDKFALDEELKFKVRARRNKQAGLWAAEKMGMSGNEAHDYADHFVLHMFDKEVLLNQLRGDFQKSGLDISDKELFAHLDDFVVSARRYFMEG